MDQVYSVSIWARKVKERFNYVCSQCGSGEDVQAVHVTPPSMGGKNTLENGITLCLQCRTKRLLADGVVRFNFSIPSELRDRLLSYCDRSGRSPRDVVKQLVADFAFDPNAGANGFHMDGEWNTHRLSVPVRQKVFVEFAKKCSSLNVSPSNAVKSLLFRYLKQGVSL